jgi:dihydropteroate synthase
VPALRHPCVPTSLLQHKELIKLYEPWDRFILATIKLLTNKLKKKNMASTQLMGILNVTPDSCVDQGRWFDHSIAIQRGIQICREGADWLDIGGESTRPGAAPISVTEELHRVIPVIKSLKQEISIPISIDTMKAKVAEAAIEAGASLINDVSGFRDPAMRQVAANSQLPICLMHMHETPITMQNNPHYPQGVVSFLIDWFKQRIDLLLATGIQEKNIILDPGIGFGKTVADNVEIIHNLYEIKALGFPVLMGLSRKSFLGKIINKNYPDLLSVSLAVNTLVILAHVDIIRVHDISEHRDVIDLMAHLYPSRSSWPLVE